MTSVVSNDQDAHQLRAHDAEQDRVREPTDEASPNIPFDNGRLVRMRDHAVDCREHLAVQRISEAGLKVVVVAGRIIEFPSGLNVELDPHLRPPVRWTNSS